MALPSRNVWASRRILACTQYISGVGLMQSAPFPGALGELLLLTTILLASILAISNVVTSNNLTGRDVMDTPTAGVLLREVARLHAHSQREQVACCHETTSTQCLILTEVGRNGPLTLADLGRRTSLEGLAQSCRGDARPGGLADQSAGGRRPTHYSDRVVSSRRDALSATERDAQCPC